MVAKTVGRVVSGKSMAAPFSAPTTRFNGTLTAERTIATVQLDLDDVRGLLLRRPLRVVRLHAQVERRGDVLHALADVDEPSDEFEVRRGQLRYWWDNVLRSLAFVHIFFVVHVPLLVPLLLAAVLVPLLVPLLRPEEGLD